MMKNRLKERNIVVRSDEPKLGLKTAFVMYGLNDIFKNRMFPQLVVVLKSMKEVSDLGSDLIEKMACYEKRLDVFMAIQEKKDRGAKNKITQQILVGTPEKILERIKFRDFDPFKVNTLIFDEWPDISEADRKIFSTITFRCKKAQRLYRIPNLEAYEKLSLHKPIFLPLVEAPAQDIHVEDSPLDSQKEAAKDCFPGRKIRIDLKPVAEVKPSAAAGSEPSSRIRLESEKPDPPVDAIVLNVTPEKAEPKAPAVAALEQSGSTVTTDTEDMNAKDKKRGVMSFFSRCAIMWGHNYYTQCPPKKTLDVFQKYTYIIWSKDINIIIIIIIIKLIAIKSMVTVKPVAWWPRLTFRLLIRR